jgi:hypothetical protein
VTGVLQREVLAKDRDTLMVNAPSLSFFLLISSTSFSKQKTMSESESVMVNGFKQLLQSDLVEPWAKLSSLEALIDVALTQK